MRLALGPILYFWARDAVFEFYRAAAEWPVDIVYLGETVCSKRRELRREDWLAIAADLADAGKEVVLSTLALLEAESEISYVRRIVHNGTFVVEANDMGAVNLAAGRVPFVAGPGINVYNAHTLAVLARAGARRWVAPVELDRAALGALLAERPQSVETEVYAFGPLPLSHSARCFTARAHNRGKDECGFVCRDYPAGLLLSTQEQEPFLRLNGVQTLSARLYALVGAIEDMRALGVDVLRVAPQPEGTEEVVRTFRAAMAGEIGTRAALRALARHAPYGLCNGHWYGQAGMEWVNDN
ncbi:MAG TPA: U32 family peptidase [Burkholderiales bacterium]